MEHAVRSVRLKCVTSYRDSLDLALFIGIDWSSSIHATNVANVQFATFHVRVARTI